MARGMGRPLAALVLSDEERSYLEGQASTPPGRALDLRSLPHDRRVRLRIP